MTFEDDPEWTPDTPIKKPLNEVVTKHGREIIDLCWEGAD